MKKFRPPLYLFLLPVYFILFLFAANAHDLRGIDLVRPVVASALLVGLIFGISLAVTRNMARSALLTFILWTTFSLYGHLYGWLKNAPHPLNFLGKHSLLAPITLVVVILLAVLVVRTRRNLSTLNRSISFILAGLTLFQVTVLAVNTVGRFRTLAAGPSRMPANTRLVSIDPADIKTKPDIYYIILDTYTREDVIRKDIGIDTRPFLDELRRRGFYVGECSSSNYSFTSVSLASSLNLDFVQDLDPRFLPGETSNALLDDFILHGKVRSTLESIGYKTVAFASGFANTQMTDAGEYLAPPEPSLLSSNVQPFESLWFKTTALRAMFDIHPPLISGWLNALSFPHSDYVQRERYILNMLPQVAGQAGPKFVFAHVIIPHVPLVFRADGSITRDDRYFRETFDQPAGMEYLIDGYKNQVEFIDSQILPIIDTILNDSAQPPVILIQGDHGLGYFDLFPILNAYYLPGEGSEALYPTISPVNSFAVVFNEYFGTKLPLHPDNSYESSYLQPFKFKLVTEKSCPVK